MTFFLVPLPGILTIPIFLLVLAAVLPAVYLLVQVYRSDRIEKEPVALILSLIGFGILAVFCSMVTESLGSRFADESTLWGRLLLYYIVVALSEEGFKYFFLTRKVCVLLRLRDRCDPRCHSRAGTYLLCGIYGNLVRAGQTVCHARGERGLRQVQGARTPDSGPPPRKL